MHEYTIGKSIMDTLINLKKQYPNKRITKVTIIAGKLRQILPQALFFYLDILKKDTEFSKIEFIYKEKPVKIKCNKCNKISKINELEFLCPLCGNYDIKVISGNELLIESIEVEEDKNGNKSV